MNSFAWYLKKIALILLIAETVVVAAIAHIYTNNMFIAFAVACVLLALLHFVVDPLWVAEASFDSKSQKFVDRYKERHFATVGDVNREFWGFFGTGEVLLGNFGTTNICYDFICLMYIPLFPIACYSGSAKVPQTWSWREVLYIYLRQWLFVIIIGSAYLINILVLTEYLNS